MSRFKPVNFEREPSGPQRNGLDKWLDELAVWWFETALPAIKKFFGFGDGPRGGIA